MTLMLADCEHQQRELPDESAEGRCAVSRRRPDVSNARYTSCWMCKIVSQMVPCDSLQRALRPAHGPGVAPLTHSTGFTGGLRVTRFLRHPGPRSIQPACR